ncbi:MAG TPA: ABC transporter permease subunit [Candidatus Binataceae bacterium]|nr:ABC transporter permease subunit [Candidatus Binataceae bacterium]
MAVAAILALFFEYKRHAPVLRGPHLSVSARNLPYYAFCSFYRMLAAYALALIFSLVYGPTAARSRAYERVMIPAIDIAQSVPVVGFFPAAIYFFVALAHGSRLGVELAAIFLIFTSQAWNMALGVFEAIRTIPQDSIEALDAFGAGGWLKLKRLLLPACVPKLVYNSILSWVAGWYYLIACEIITVGPAHYRLPGLGSYLMEAADKGRSGELIAGLAALLAIIILMDVIVWQPLSTWAEKFRYEFAATSEPIRSLGMLEALGAVGPGITRAVRSVLIPIVNSIHRAQRATPPFNPAAYPILVRAGKALRVAAVGSVLLLTVYGLVSGVAALIRTLMQPWPAEVKRIPAATIASMLRMIAAYAISLAWTVPCAIYASESPRFARRLAPIAEIVGSVPATALFPLIVIFVIHVTGGMNLASILLILTGMQWYLLFNLLAGASQIPADLKEASRSFGLSRFATWRKLTLPAIVPSLLTGSITAWGGGWNALILSEYFVYRSKTYQVFGLGAMLDDATYRSGNGLMILLTLLSMVLVVVLLNRLMWRRLYDVATERYRMDY